MDRWQLRLRRRRASTGAVWIAPRCDLEQVVKAVRPYQHTSRTQKWDAPTIVPGSEFWTQPSMHRPHWNEILDALQEDVDFCEDGETTIERDGAIAIPGVFCITDGGQEAIEENEVPQILLQARPAFQHPGHRAVRKDLNVAQTSRGFFGPRRSASGRDQGPRMKRSSISPAETAHEVCKMSQSGTLGSRVSRKKIEDNATTKGTTDVQ